MDTDTDLRLRHWRAEIYATLSECFKEPHLAFAADVSSGRLRQHLAQAFAALGLELDVAGLWIEGTAEAVFDRLKREFTRLFENPFGALVAVESVYKPWGGEEAGASSDTPGDGLLMGQPAVEMLALYRKAGLTIPPEFRSMPDHLCLELEFMGLLCQQGTPSVQAEFLERHLDWIGDLREAAPGSERSPFYAAVLAVTDAFIAHERNATRA